MMSGCPGSRIVDQRNAVKGTEAEPEGKIKSRLCQWPVQLHLVSPHAPYFQDSKLLISADCVPFAYANFHKDLLEGRSLAIGCPKLDETDEYLEKIVELIKSNNIEDIKVAIMEVPCCMGLYMLVHEAVRRSGKEIPIEKVVLSIQGEPY